LADGYPDYSLGCPDGCNFPTIQTNFIGPGLSAVARLATTASPTLLNEFVASYTTDHITLTNTGPGGGGSAIEHDHDRNLP